MVVVGYKQNYVREVLVNCLVNISSLVQSLLQKGYPFKNIFNFTTASDGNLVAVVERLPALHYSVDIIFLSFGIMGFIVEL